MKIPPLKIPLILIAALLWSPLSLQSGPEKPATIKNTRSEQQYVLVKRVVDGDTLVLATGERVRLIGVDTPETVHPHKPVEYFGKEASSFTKRMVEGKRVRLQYDETTKDRYGRVLAYVFLEDNTLLNAEIIKQGYGFAYTKFPFKLMAEFRQYERDARENQRGLWDRN